MNANGDFERVTFSCRSGGAPRNRMGIPEVVRTEEDAYMTVANGPAVRGSITIEFQDTGTRDADGRTIYATPMGVNFVFVHVSGNECCFDRGRLAPPRKHRDPPRYQ